MNIRYLARVLGGVRIKNLMGVIGRIHEKTGKNRVALFFDIISLSHTTWIDLFDNPAKTGTNLLFSVKIL